MNWIQRAICTINEFSNLHHFLFQQIAEIRQHAL